MKKIVLSITLLIVTAAACVGIYGWVTYTNTTNSVVPAPTATALGTSLSPIGSQWSHPLFGGLLYKHFEIPPQDITQQLGTISEYSIALEGIQGYKNTATLSLNGVGEVWRGNPEDAKAYSFTQNGDYTLEIECELPQAGKQAYGRFAFRATFTVDIQPQIETSATQVKQGDVLAIQVSNMLSPFPLTASTETEGVLVTFTPKGNNAAIALVAVTHNRPVGEYILTVDGGGYNWEIPYTVVDADFEKQNLTIDTSNPVISEAASPKAYQQYRDKIPPFFTQASDEKYWQGHFIWPVEGRISTTYGLFRYTNGASTPSRHSGIDIAIPEGTQIVAPANGQVVFAEYLLNTGWTIVLEHGGGLKTYYYHMFEIEVEPGATVTQGQNIGKVGTTGYSTGAHLHYEVRIGAQTLNPFIMFDGTSAMYTFEE